MCENKKAVWYWLLLIVGVALVAIAFVWNNRMDKAVGGVCIGLGGALSAVMASRLATVRMYKRNPQLQRAAHVNELDERNIVIRNRAKAKAFDFTAPLFCGVALVTVLLRAELIVTLLIVAGYATIQTIYFVYLSKYNKEM